jgi:hypothetical protein
MRLSFIVSTTTHACVADATAVSLRAVIAESDQTSNWSRRSSRMCVFRRIPCPFNVT